MNNEIPSNAEPPLIYSFGDGLAVFSPRMHNHVILVRYHTLPLVSAGSAPRLPINQIPFDQYYATQAQLSASKNDLPVIHQQTLFLSEAKSLYGYRASG